MIKITHDTAKEYIRVYDMPVGSIGVTEFGDYFYRTNNTATCLNNPGKTYSVVGLQSDSHVRILPKGTKLTIEILS